MTTTPRVVQLCDQRPCAAPRRSSPPSRPRAIDAARCARRGRAGRHAGSRRTGCRCAPSPSRIASRSCVERHRGRRRGCRARRRRSSPTVEPRARRPSPCRSARSGTSTPNSSQSGVCSVGCVITQRNLGVAQVRRVDDLADEPQLVVGRAGGSSGTSSGTTSVEAGGLDHVVDGDAGVHRADPHRVVGRLEVEHAEVRHDAADLVERGPRSGPSCGGAVVADARHARRPARRTPRRVVGHPVARRVVDRVARARRGRRAAAPSAWPSGPMHAMFWLPKRSTCVAPIITWRRPDHTMSNICRYGHPRLDDLRASAVDADRQRARDQLSASPSVMTRSGSKVSAARRPPIVGIVPIGLARISPSPRHASAHATTHTSARVGVARRSAHDATPITRLVVGFGDVDVLGPERRPTPRGSFAVAAYSVWNASSRS